MCKKGNILLVTLRVLIIITCVLHLLFGGIRLFRYIAVVVVAGDYIDILYLLTPILAIFIGIFGIVAVSKRNLWLVGIFAVGKLIMMSLYSVLAAQIAQILNQLPDDLIEAQFQDEGLTTTSTTFKPNEDDDFSTYPLFYIIVVTKAIVEVLTFFASLSYFYIVRGQKELTSSV